jgi:phenylalanyl-tRNA synthetase beta chain
MAPDALPVPYLQRRHISQRLAHLGFFQTVTLGFVSPEADAKYSKKGAGDSSSRALANPLGVEYSVMRGSLLPGLWEVAEANQRHGAKEIRLFEIAPVYKSSPEGLAEADSLCLVWSGYMGGEDPLTPLRPVMAADLIGVARDLGIMEDARVIELASNAFGLEMPLGKLGGSEKRTIPNFQPFSRYPMVTRDLSLLVSLGLSYGELERAIKNAIGQAPLQDIRCVDVFKDPKLTAENKQAWLIRLKFQSSDRTLTGEEVESWVNAAIDAAVLHGGALRS